MRSKSQVEDAQLEDLLLRQIESAGSQGMDYLELVEVIHQHKSLNRSGRTPDKILDTLPSVIARRREGERTVFVRQALLPSAQVARRLGVTQRTVQSWHKAGRLPGIRLPGGHLRFAEEAVRALQEPAGEFAISGRDDPVLTELWDNPADAAYDKL